MSVRVLFKKRKSGARKQAHCGDVDDLVHIGLDDLHNLLLLLLF